MGANEKAAAAYHPHTAPTLADLNAAVDLSKYVVQTMSHEEYGDCWCGPNNHPEQREQYEYAAQEFDNVREVVSDYHHRGWATPISGDGTKLRGKA